MSTKPDSTPLQTVLELQEAVSAAHVVVANLESNIATGEQILAENPPVKSNLLNLQIQRENALAGIMTGAATDADLKTIDKAIAAEQAAITKSTSATGGFIADTAQTIAGLKRKLEEEETKLAELEFSRYHSVHAYLLAEAEQIGTEYIVAAQKVAATHRRLLAIDKLLDKHQRGSTITAAHPVKLVIPVFNLTAHNRAKSPDFPGVLHESVKTYQGSTCLDAATRIERERINNNGVSI